jgi:O-antigen/teichoic acid export membrane protein
MGVAVSTGSAVLFKNLYCYYFGKKYARLRLDVKGLVTIALNALLMGVVLGLLRPLAKGLLTLILASLLGLGVYLAMAFINKAFSMSEREYINKLLPKPFFIF